MHERDRAGLESGGSRSATGPRTTLSAPLAPNAGSARRPYERPEIIDYGSVRELTRGTGSKPLFDMMSGTRRLI
jgi:hypothetical protein